jgi:hypothetical protein
MSVTVAHAIKVLQERAADDPAVAEVVLFLADDSSGPDDPFGASTDRVRSAARSVNARRQREQREAAAGAALDTVEVVALLRSISDRKGVDRRRQRGQLLGWRAGSRVLHPAWQFDRRRGETRPHLAQVIAALSEVTTDAEGADRLMMTPRDDLDGATLAELYAAGQLDTVLRLVLAAGDQS